MSLVDSRLPGKSIMSKPTERGPNSPRCARVEPDPMTGTGEWVIACRVCRREMVVSTEEINGYLANGWPKCCDREMAPTVRPAGD